MAVAERETGNDPLQAVQKWISAAVPPTPGVLHPADS